MGLPLSCGTLKGLLPALDAGAWEVSKVFPGAGLRVLLGDRRL
jgi:hypothetical protein